MSQSDTFPALEMSNATVVSLRDPTKDILEGVNWTVAPGEFWVIGGQQFSGKTDLLTLAAGLVSPTVGTCQIHGQDTRLFGEDQLALRLRVGFLFDGGQLFNRQTILENVTLPLRYHKNMALAEATSAVAPLLEFMELTSMANLTPPNVGAGWRHRAAVARALTLRPDFLLLDNPLSGLGPKHRQWMLQFLDQLWRGHELCGGRPMTLVVTTDDLRPWRGAPRNAGHKYAILYDNKFSTLGSWAEVEKMDHPTIKDLMAGDLLAELEETPK